MTPTQLHKQNLLCFTISISLRHQLAEIARVLPEVTLIVSE
ncbi:MAG: hypothetical protein ACOVOF_05115 [Chryseotalea sp.]